MKKYVYSSSKTLGNALMICCQDYYATIYSAEIVNTLVSDCAPTLGQKLWYTLVLYACEVKSVHSSFYPGHGVGGNVTLIQSKTNLWFMYLSAKGIRNCLKNGHEIVFLVSYIGYLLVGCGSFLFHASLKCMFLPCWSGRNTFLTACV